tara:strand:- start:1822 stop:2337 length:516 start_codon:yes stop_codon:yes gene_type:complete
MKILKHIESFVRKNYFFIEGKIDLDAEYFINKINQGIQERQHNLTHVKGDMTDWRYFAHDEVFLKTIVPVIKQCIDPLDLPPYNLSDAWGIAEKFSDRTTQHDHMPCVFSGILYLNEVDQPTCFPEIKQEIKPEKGKLILFDSILQHYAKRNITDKTKYAVVFNAPRIKDF